MQERIWLKNYQSGVPYDIDADKYQSVASYLIDACQKHEHDIAFSNFRTELSYGELATYAKRFAAFLHNHLQCAPGTRIAIMMPNVLQYPIALFGTLRAGCVVVNTNPMYTVDELVHQLNDATVTIIVVLENFVNTVLKAMPKTKLQSIIVTNLGDLHAPFKKIALNFVNRYIKRNVNRYHYPQAFYFEEVLAIGDKYTFEDIALSGQDTAFLQYTGGTTGIAKGAILTHRNIIANIEQAYAWVYPVLKNADGAVITPLPLYHIFSLLANCLLFFKFGAKNILITNPRDIASFVKILAYEPFSVLTGVNTLFNALVSNERFKKLDFSHLKITLGGGMPVTKAVADKWFQITKCPLTQAYGLTEASPAVTINPLYHQAYSPSIGLPIPSTNISIRDSNDNELALDQVGELCVKGPQVMKGYWNKESETALVIKNEWLHTGDLAYINNEGYVYIVDRLKDVILVSGFKVYPNEVEAVIHAHPLVSEVGVTRDTLNDGNEIVVAYIVKKHEHLTKDEIISYCKEHLTKYKIPKEIYFVKLLPKTPVGKILRKELHRYKQSAE